MAIGTHGRGLAIGAGALVLIAAGAALAGWQRHSEESRRNARNRAAVLDDMRLIQVALKAYETDCGDWPPEGNAGLVHALAVGRGRAWFEFRAEQVRSSGEWLDPWGTPFAWQRPSPGRWRLVSAGPDRRFEDGAGDDIATGN